MAMASSTLLLAIFLQPQCWIARLLAARPLVHLGRISYGVYLFHAPLLTGLEVQAAFLGAAYRTRPLPSDVFTAGDRFDGAAALHYRVVERRFLAMRGPRPFLARARFEAPSDAGRGASATRVYVRDPRPLIVQVWQGPAGLERRADSE